MLRDFQSDDTTTGEAIDLQDFAPITSADLPGYNEWHDAHNPQPDDQELDRMWAAEMERRERENAA